MRSLSWLPCDAWRSFSTWASRAFSIWSKPGLGRTHASYFFPNLLLKKKKNTHILRHLHWYGLRSNLKIRLIGSSQVSKQERKEGVVSTKTHLTHFIRAHKRFNTFDSKAVVPEKKFQPFNGAWNFETFWSRWNGLLRNASKTNVVSFRSFSFWVATYLCICV